MQKIGASPEQQEIINYAYEHTKELDFVYTLEAENGLWKLDRRSNTIGANGYRDVGLCQLNRQYHHSFIDSSAFGDFKEQIHYCWGVYLDAVKKGRLETTFYGYNRRHVAAKNFIVTP